MVSRAGPVLFSHGLDGAVGGGRAGGGPLHALPASGSMLPVTGSSTDQSGSSSGGGGGRQRLCSQCGKNGHLAASCFEVIGFPDWYPRGGGGGCRGGRRGRGGRSDGAPWYKRGFHRPRVADGDFGNLQICRLSHSEVLIRKLIQSTNLDESPPGMHSKPNYACVGGFGPPSLSLLRVPRVACPVVQFLGENLPRFIRDGDGGTSVTSPDWGRKTYSCVFVGVLSSTDIKVLPEGIVGTLLQSISRCSCHLQSGFARRAVGRGRWRSRLTVTTECGLADLISLVRLYAELKEASRCNKVLVGYMYRSIQRPEY
ncbi:retroelement pol polyprotein-like [Striga asiatica]|uniref:Retroelement pol polyprotein-like n=1 Tax=Striga asiatica TaxID=4170 RepID=A0A5A7QM41_STRAF|nr:retroelement pol polyprotein-like [Striga asiatica]